MKILRTCADANAPTTKSSESCRSKTCMLEKYVVFGDSDWGGSESTRRTSGILEQLVTHPTNNSCSTQHVIALSSREAECGSERVTVLAVAGLKRSRIGSGRVRHFDVRRLWTQETVQTGRSTLEKVGTTENVSDLTAKYHEVARNLDANGWAAISQRTSIRNLDGYTRGR